MGRGIQFQELNLLKFQLKKDNIKKMEIVSKSLHHSNIVFVFEGKFIQPDNSEILSLYKGELASGSNFIDDINFKIKILDLPRLKIQLVIEPDRVIIEDNSESEPENSPLIWEAANIYFKLFKNFKLKGFGFNFDIYYRSRNVIALQDLFLKFSNKKNLENYDLLDLGIQFSLNKKLNQIDQYFLKIVSPMELAIRLNSHFNIKELPINPPNLGEKDELNKERILPLQKIFEKSYNDADEIISNLLI